MNTNGQSVIDVFDYGTLTFWHYPPWTRKIFGDHVSEWKTAFYISLANFLTNRVERKKYSTYRQNIYIGISSNKLLLMAYAFHTHTHTHIQKTFLEFDI